MKNLKIAIEYTPDHTDERERVTIEKVYVQNDVESLQRLVNELAKRMHLENFSIDPNQTRLDL